MARPDITPSRPHQYRVAGLEPAAKSRYTRPCMHPCSASLSYTLLVDHTGVEPVSRNTPSVSFITIITCAYHNPSPYPDGAHGCMGYGIGAFYENLPINMRVPCFSPQDMRTHHIHFGDGFPDCLRQLPSSVR